MSHRCHGLMSVLVTSPVGRAFIDLPGENMSEVFLEKGRLPKRIFVLMPLILLFTFSGVFTPVFAENIYLDQVVQWNPGTVGSERVGWGDMVDENGTPIQNNNALGPPTGKGAYSSGPGNQTVGINGSAVFRFEEGWYIFDGAGDDFVTFQCNFAWGSVCDNLCNELGHIEVSEDGVTWYYNMNEGYDINPHPNQNNGDYIYAHVEGVHGSQPTWANYQEDIQAQRIVSGEWENIPGVYVSRNFRATDPYLGGTRFDLSNFRSRQNGSSWPANGRMRYIRLTDDNNILDGQDYNIVWRLGSHINAAMGINVAEDAPTPERPEATTNAAQSVTTVSAILKATVNPNNSNTTCRFQYGPTTSYDCSTANQSIGSGCTAVTVSGYIADLRDSCTYHFRVVATNGEGTSYGADRSFSTLPPAPANTVYVIPPGDGGNCGGHAPCRSSLVEAVNYALNSSPGTEVEINVASGTYNERIDAVNPRGKTIMVKGQWRPDFSGYSTEDTVLKGGVRTTGGSVIVLKTVIRPF